MSGSVENKSQQAGADRVPACPRPDPLSLRDERFRAAFAGVVNMNTRERTGIGMQKEKSLHAVLKNYADPDPSHQEVPVGRYVADICDMDAGRIVEIQTANMGAMRDKLAAFLPQFQVTILYPIAHRKKVTWIDPGTGEFLKSSLSHMTGSFYEVFRELYRISAYLTHPNLTIAPMLVDMTEYRLLDGWSADGKRGSHRFDRIPEALVDELLLRQAEDYAVFMPVGTDLPVEFTARDFEDAVGIHRRSIHYAQVLSLLTQLGVVERVGMTNRRAWIYRTRIQNQTGRNLGRVKRGRKT